MDFESIIFTKVNLILLFNRLSTFTRSINAKSSQKNPHEMIKDIKRLISLRANKNLRLYDKTLCIDRQMEKRRQQQTTQELLSIVRNNIKFTRSTLGEVTVLIR